MRVFAALEIPDDVIDHVGRWQRSLVELHPDLKWVSEGNMHLTLRFFGDIGPEALDVVLRIMSEWHPGPLDFALDRLGTFGRKDSPSVYWLGGEFPEVLQDIAGRLGSIPDDRGRVSRGGFIPHLTVARRRGGQLPRLQPPDAISGTITAASVIDSKLTSRGPEYRHIRKFDLH